MYSDRSIDMPLVYEISLQYFKMLSNMKTLHLPKKHLKYEDSYEGFLDNSVSGRLLIILVFHPPLLFCNVIRVCSI